MYVDEFSCLIVVKDKGRRGVLSVICTKTLKIDYGAFNTSIVTLKVRLFNKIFLKISGYRNFYYINIQRPLNI